MHHTLHAMSLRSQASGPGMILLLHMRGGYALQGSAIELDIGNRVVGILPGIIALAQEQGILCPGIGGKGDDLIFAHQPTMVDQRCQME